MVEPETPSEHPNHRIRLVGDAEGIIAAILAMAGFFIPAHPGGLTDSQVWFVVVVVVVGIIGGLGLSGVRHGAVAGKLGGVLALGVVAFIVVSVRLR